MTQYQLNNVTSLALRVLETLKGPRVAILEGPPGTGKTYFSEFLASRWGGKYLYYLAHNWTSDEELFLSVHVGRVAAGVEKPEDAYEYGVLTKAAVASHEGPVVLCLDELDKAPQRAEALLLDFLQHGRVVLQNEVIKAYLDHLTVVITTNGIRPLLEATLRRGFRVQMTFLPPQVEADVIRKRTGAPTGVARLVVAMMSTIREKGATKPSLQEGVKLVESLVVAESGADADLLIQGWLCKEPEDWDALLVAFKSPGAALWGEWKRGVKK